MILLVGLGNPGLTYQNNRHNVGFMFVDYIRQRATDNGQQVKKDKYLLSETCELTTGYGKLITAKPQTFMNRSGEAVKKLLANWHLDVETLIVIHDELDLVLGDFKINKTGSPLHNGITSIENTLGTKNFLRVRVGIDNRNPDNRMEGERYVLSDFLPQERKKIEETFPTIYQRLGEYI